MTDTATAIYYDYTMEIPVEPDGTPTTIRSAPAVAALPRAAVAAQSGGARAYGNASLNGRSEGKVAAGPWAVRHEAALPAGARPAWVYAAGGRVLVEGQTWELFKADGAHVAGGGLLDGRAALDAARGLLYVPEPIGVVRARRLDDGAPAFAALPRFGRLFTYPFVAPVGHDLLVVGIEKPPAPHRGIAGQRALAETMELPDPLPTGGGGLAHEPPRRGELLRGSTLLLTALHGHTVTLTTQNRILHAGLDLKITAALQGDFTPQTMSVDEAGRAYLIVTAGGRKALWVVAPNGDRTVARELPADLPALVAPPLVGYDHRIYLLAPDRIIAVGADGTPLWEHRSHGLVSGGTVTADDHLLLSDGEELAAFDAAGNRRLLHRFPAQLMTGPYLTPDGQALVATEDTLYWLALGASGAE